MIRTQVEFVELNMTGTFEGRSANWASAPRDLCVLKWSYFFNSEVRSRLHTTKVALTNLSSFRSLKTWDGANYFDDFVKVERQGRRISGLFPAFPFKVIVFPRKNLIFFLFRLRTKQDMLNAN